MSLTNELFALATKMDLNHLEAVSLSTVVEVCAQKSQLSQSEFIDIAMANDPVSDYVKSVCQKPEVMTEVVKLIDGE